MDEPPTTIASSQGGPRRVCQITYLRPEMRERYLELHATVWPEVEDRLRRSHFANYSIFLRDDLLVGYFDYVGDDFEADLTAIELDETSRRWWTLTDPCQLDPDEGSPGGPWRNLAEVWHLES